MVVIYTPFDVLLNFILCYFIENVYFLLSEIVPFKNSGYFWHQNNTDFAEALLKSLFIFL